MNRLVDLLLPLIFERIPGLKGLSGYKRTIGNILLIVGAALEAAQTVYPEYAPGIGQALLFIGFVTRVLGDLHADSKERRGS